MNLLTFFEQINSPLDLKTRLDVLYLEVAKAFDKIPHGRLIEKIRAPEVCE